MNTYADKTQENKSNSVNNLSKQQSKSESAFQFVDNRPEAIAQRKLQEIANNSPQVKQLKVIQDMANNYASQTTQRKENLEEETLQGKFETIQKKENKTGLPDNLKSGVENLSGYSLDDVKVHYNSDKPAQLNAHAYAQGTDIHLGAGQEKHLPHEAWHVVQQKQGRVQPTMQMKGGVNVNDDEELENEADVMGGKAQDNLSVLYPLANNKQNSLSPSSLLPIQGKFTGDLESMTFENILENVATHLDVNPEDIRAYVNETGEQTLKQFGSILAIVHYVKPYLEIDLADRFLADQRMVGDIQVIKPKLTQGNCHGFSFGEGGDNKTDINTLDELMQNWNGNTPILLCTDGSFIISHTAKLEGGRYTQTLPDGPIFSTTRDVLEAKYVHCYDLPGQLEVYLRERAAYLEEQKNVTNRLNAHNRLMKRIEGIVGKNKDYYSATNLNPETDWKEIEKLIITYQKV